MSTPDWASWGMHAGAQAVCTCVPQYVAYEHLSLALPPLLLAWRGAAKRRRFTPLVATYLPKRVVVPCEKHVWMMLLRSTLVQ